MDTSAPNPWSLYWQGGHIDSCIANAGAEDRAIVSAVWKDLVSALPAAAKVLDLATGNGAVPLDLLTADPELEITGVDLAQIAPDTLLDAAPLLSRVQFLGGIDICKLPFEAHSFDAVTSQFGIEYAPLAQALAEVARVLKPRGRLRFLVHHVDSAVVAPAAELVAEIDHLYRDNGLLAAFNQYLAGAMDLASLEAAGRNYMGESRVRTQHISGQVMVGINQVIVDLQAQPQRAQLLAQSMQSRMRAERSRLGQLRSAALDIDGASTLCHQLESLGLGDVESRTVEVPGEAPALIGWQFSATMK